ncbi:MAG: hypothetical protein GY739_21680 [Mesoflavibacter sp.]|nr:hypothetical protein [Mesoflavibacter sp.]
MNKPKKEDYRPKNIYCAEDMTEWYEKYNEALIIYINWMEKQLLLHGVSGSLPSEDEIETASLDYREKSDNENMDEDDLNIIVNWWDKQEAFQAGAKWMAHYR